MIGQMLASCLGTLLAFGSIVLAEQLWDGYHDYKRRNAKKR